ncbi:hypothetical protein Tco_1139324 [Tanacetum coccineum]
MGGVGSTSNSQFPGFSSQAPMTPEQQAFFETQQEALLAFQQNFQNRQQNSPQFEMPQQQNQSSNSIPQTEPQPKKVRKKHAAKKSKGKEAEPTGEVTLRWSTDEEALLAECYVAVSEDRYDFKQMECVEPSLPKVQRNLQKKPPKWDTPEVAPVDLTEDENVHDEHVPAPVNTDKLFRADPRPRPHKLRLKREAAERAFQASKNKDDTITRLEELRFLAFSTKDLSDDDAYWINIQKQQIKDKLRAQIPRGSGSNSQAEDSDE